MGVLSCVFVIIGAIVGAGFASGKEMYTFFYIHGKNGIIGIAISVLLLGYAIYKTLKVIKKYNLQSYDDLLDIAIGNIKLKKINIKIILNFIINTFLLITFFVMCAGFTAYFKQVLEIPEIISSILVAVFCYILLNKNIKGVLILNWLLIPMMIIVLIILGIKTFTPTYELETIASNNLWYVKAILYASYNSITLISILLPLKKYIKNKKDIMKISVICIIAITILSGVIMLLLNSITGDIGKIEMPAVYASGNLGLVYKYLYGIIIIGAIITTAISSAYGFLNNVSKTKEKYLKNNLLICLVSIFVSFLGFSNLVNNLYPVFGILGLLQLLFIFRCK